MINRNWNGCTSSVRLHSEPFEVNEDELLDGARHNYHPLGPGAGWLQHEISLQWSWKGNSYGICMNSNLSNTAQKAHRCDKTDKLAVVYKPLMQFGQNSMNNVYHTLNMRYIHWHTHTSSIHQEHIIWVHIKMYKAAMSICFYNNITYNTFL